jgi:AhpD family alkylhydroperoxidase
MMEQLYPRATRELAEQRSRLAPGPAEAFRAFSQSVFADGALSAKTKQLIAVAVAHVTQCPYCIRAHTNAAMRRAATAEEIMEAIWVAAEMRAGGAYAHSALALDAIAHHQTEHPREREEIAAVSGTNRGANVRSVE